MRFSERHGYKPVRDVIQVDSVDEILRNKLWNTLKIFYWDTAAFDQYAFGMQGGYRLDDPLNRRLAALSQRLWFEFFKLPLDRLSNNWQEVLRELRTFFFEALWYEVYDFIEFVAHNYPRERNELDQRFLAACNNVLEKEMSAYRFVDGLIAPIANHEEVRAIESAIEEGGTLVAAHLRRALELLSDREQPDYRNSIKESISAVESLAAQVIKKKKGALGQLLAQIEGHIVIHPALRDAFNKLYGYTSDESGIRHALTEEKAIDFDDAKFMLVACSAFVGYVNGKLKA